MNYTETVILVRYVRALCPQQKFDEYTPDAWHDLLADYQLDECKTACQALARRQPFIAPAEIIREVFATHRGRLTQFQYEPGTDDGEDDPREYLRRLRAQITDVANGHRPAELPAPAHSGPSVGQLLTGLVRQVDEEPL